MTENQTLEDKLEDAQQRIMYLEAHIRALEGERASTPAEPDVKAAWEFGGPTQEQIELEARRIGYAAVENGRVYTAYHYIYADQARREILQLLADATIPLVTELGKLKSELERALNTQQPAVAPTAPAPVGGDVSECSGDDPVWWEEAIEISQRYQRLGFLKPDGVQPLAQEIRACMRHVRYAQPAVAPDDNYDPFSAASYLPEKDAATVALTEQRTYGGTAWLSDVEELGKMGVSTIAPSILTDLCAHIRELTAQPGKGLTESDNGK